MSTLIFCASLKRAHELARTYPPDALPAILGWGGSIVSAINDLHLGRDVVALLDAAASDWVLPGTTVVKIDPQSRTEERLAGQIAQAEALISRSAPHTAGSEPPLPVILGWGLD